MSEFEITHTDGARWYVLHDGRPVFCSLTPGFWGERAALAKACELAGVGDLFRALDETIWKGSPEAKAGFLGFVREALAGAQSRAHTTYQNSATPTL